MPKVIARVLATKTDEQGRMLAKIQMNGSLPPAGSIIRVKWGSVRTLPQNALYWKYLSWLIEYGGLKEHGHFDPGALHENLKCHFLAQNGASRSELESVEGVTTTDLTKSEFSEYFDKVDQFIQEFFEISTEPFWAEYRQNYQAK